MNPRRTALLVLLLPLVGVLFLGRYGGVEVSLWLAVVGLWVWAFVAWAPRAGRTAPTQSAAAPDHAG